MLGRAAMGETVRNVTLRDSWRIRRAGRLVFADGLRIDGDSTSVLAGGATGGGAAALATLVLVAPDAEARLDAARAALAGAAMRGRGERLERRAGGAARCRRRPAASLCADKAD